MSFTQPKTRKEYYIPIVPGENPNSTLRKFDRGEWSCREVPIVEAAPEKKWRGFPSFDKPPTPARNSISWFAEPCEYSITCTPELEQEFNALCAREMLTADEISSMRMICGSNLYFLGEEFRKFAGVDLGAGERCATWDSLLHRFTATIPKPQIFVPHILPTDMTASPSPWARNKVDGELVMASDARVPVIASTTDHFEAEYPGEPFELVGDELIELAPDSATNPWSDIRDINSDELVVPHNGRECKLKAVPSFEVSVKNGSCRSRDGIEIARVSVPDGTWEIADGKPIRLRPDKPVLRYADILEIVESVTPSEYRKAVKCPKVARGTIPWLNGPAVPSSPRYISTKALYDKLCEGLSHKELAEWAWKESYVIPLPQLFELWTECADSISARQILVGGWWGQDIPPEPVELVHLEGVDYPRRCLGSSRGCPAVAAIIYSQGQFCFTQYDDRGWDCAMSGLVTTKDADPKVAFLREIDEELLITEYVEWDFFTVSAPICNVLVGVAKVSQQPNIVPQEGQEIWWRDTPPDRMRIDAGFIMRRFPQTEIGQRVMRQVESDKVFKSKRPDL